MSKYDFRNSQLYQCAIGDGATVVADPARAREWQLADVEDADGLRIELESLAETIRDAELSDMQRQEMQEYLSKVLWYGEQPADKREDSVLVAWLKGMYELAKPMITGFGPILRRIGTKLLLGKMGLPEEWADE